MRCKTAALLFVGCSLVVCLGEMARAQQAKEKQEKPEPEYRDPEVAVPLPAAPAQAVPMMRIAPAARVVPGRPARSSSGLPFELGDLVLAKFDEGSKGPRVVALIEQTRTEMQTVTVTFFRQEVQTRKVFVPDANGEAKEVEQKFTVAVPETKEVERAVPVAVGKKPTAFAFDKLRVYKLDGTKVTAAEAKSLLEKTTPVFLLRGYTGDIKPVEGVYLQAINPNCLIIATEPDPAAEFPNVQGGLPPAIEIRKADDPFAGE